MANALSRIMEVEVTTLALITFLIPDWIEELKQSYELSIEIRIIVDLLSQGAERPKGYTPH